MHLADHTPPCLHLCFHEWPGLKGSLRLYNPTSQFCNDRNRGPGMTITQSQRDRAEAEIAGCWATLSGVPPSFTLLPHFLSSSCRVQLKPSVTQSSSQFESPMVLLWGRGNWVSSTLESTLEDTGMGRESKPSSVGAGWLRCCPD